MSVWVRRYGIRVGMFGITWTDLWTGKHGLEIVWQNHAVSVGFRGVP